MKKFNVIIYLMVAITLAGCSSMNKSQKGAVIGAAGGGASGAVIGRASGNTALGAIIGATVGGVAGTVIGREMDKQAAEMEREVPDAKVERVGEGIVVEFDGDILFGFDQSGLTPEAINNLGSLTQILNKYPNTDIVIQGHTDSKGSDSYNQALSERRANAVSNYLIAHDIKNSRISTVGYGETAPKYSNDTEVGRAQNRRVEFLITANEKMIEEAREEAEGSGNN
jgi:outer membrane protein OmpA-like peptidoglycan-associated protein